MIPHDSKPSLPVASEPPSPFSLLRALGWAFYLGSSWTWCIGMFLPALLVRDYGIPGFVAFAVPNVLGAAAMGWVLGRAGAITILSRHRTAVVLFSVVTVAFQGWFVLRDVAVTTPIVFEFDQMVSVSAKLPLLIAAAALFLMSIFALTTRRGFLLGGVFAWAASALCAWVLYGTGDLSHSIHALDSVAPGYTTRQLSLLAPVCVFGFLLCPYLDATFLRARVGTTNSESRVAFSLGFGVVFYAMILLTLGYVYTCIGDRAGLAIVSVHILGQLLFTIAAHVAELIRLVPGRALAAVLVMTALLSLGGRLAMAAVDLTSISQIMPSHEVVYRLFMSFYGLVFPTYVWLCMIPSRDGHHGPRRDKLLTLAAAVGLAAPFFYMGFIERQTAYLGPGLLIVLLSRLVVRAFAAPANSRAA